MRRLVVGSLAGILALSVSADAGQRDWYVGIEGGVEFSGSFNADQSDAGVAVLATVGRRLGAISLEGELAYRSTDEEMFALVDIDQVSVMVNAIYEIPLSETFSISLGAGVGYDHISAHADPIPFSPGFDDDDTQTAAQLKLGLNYAVSETTDLCANYRVMTTFENKFTDVDNSTLTVGLRFDL